jgi:hypothetical protein
VSEPFQLRPLPTELWGSRRVQRELGIDGWTFRELLITRQLPRPVLRRDRRSLWLPAAIRAFKEQRRRRLG